MLILKFTKLVKKKKGQASIILSLLTVNIKSNN